MGRPVLRRKHQRQSIRLTRNGFSLRGQRLYVAKVGDIRVAWSRALPSVPSSVTVIKEADGRYYASFVVERGVTPLPVCGCEVGIDLGLASLIVTSDGEVIANPRFLRVKERALARAQRGLSRTRRGSANRARARHRVAVLHRKVREARLDHAHKIALRLVRDNQAVYAEGLCVAGLAGTRLARSVQDADWSQLLRSPRCRTRRSVAARGNGRSTTGSTLAALPGAMPNWTASSPISPTATASPWTGFYVAKMMYGIYARAWEGALAPGTTAVAVIIG